MKELTMILFERLGLLLVIAFVLTRTPGFRSLLYREYSLKMSIVHAFVFGLFGVASTITGIMMDGETIIRSFIWTVEADQLVVSSSLVAIVMAGLLGGPFVGFGAGSIAGAHLLFLGGIGAVANGIVNPLTGLLAGLTARFFSNERVISPMKALFIGIFPPVLHMQLLLIINPGANGTVAIVNQIGLPLVLSNSIAIAIFTAMIGIVLREQENEAALAAKQALSIAEEALPFLKKDYPQQMAAGIADLLHERLRLAAVSVTSGTEVLAHVGIADDHHRAGDQIITAISREAMRTKEMKIAYSRSEIQCGRQDCPLDAAIIIPVVEADEATWLIKFYFRKAQHIRPVEIMLAKGLGQLMSKQLNTIAAEKLKSHIRDAELRNLQAQINPHFLFNTLHLISSLFREDSERARYITVQLANYMRFNLKLVSNPLVKLEKECAHVAAYIDIIQARFASQMAIHFSRPDHLPEVYIPPSTIQPLVENAVQHGLRNVTHNGRIDVRIKEETDTWCISVTDNGIGFSRERLLAMREKQAEDADRTGLNNVNQRLIQLVGETAQLQFENLDEGGCKVLFRIPKTMQQRKEEIS
ncbi:LytS/YhcK type 5TM receptor domain-containing protein [Virgibacillus sp. LDC-1]|uniref:LytS/YhcK type 5TM receptor domain-containing protein n=1 Tax=Virgibacillus sp. LDC-1 TaxID=3039856 RepID=UPI0024DE195E|nr:LytS/YhcK type 5TM receptor domain-containing protein [Virgibacillus sp. LDC-1]